MKPIIRWAVPAILLCASPCLAQELSPKWEELTSADFVKALELSKGTCALPLGIVEKHGPTGPMGVDLINVRFTTEMATRQEYTVMFPEYFVGQIFEARHWPGTIAYSSRLQLEMLQETVSEMARNGCRKVIVVNGHGGNNFLLQYFAQTQLDSPKDYVVYAVMGSSGAEGMPEAARASKPGVDGHAGEGEISNVMASRPGLAHPERAPTESGADMARLDLPDGVYTGIWWYAKYPNHYQGDAAGANSARGAAAEQVTIARIANAIRAIKRDEVAPRLQKEFFEKAANPLATKPMK